MNFDINALSAAIGRHLRARRSAVMRETAVHEAIAAAFSEIGVRAEAEFRHVRCPKISDIFAPGPILATGAPNMGRWPARRKSMSVHKK